MRFRRSSPMSHFFFDLQECGTTVRDEEGRALSDLAEARTEAIREARAVIGCEIGEGRICLSCRIEIRDEADRIVDTVLFRDAVTITGL